MPKHSTSPGAKSVVNQRSPYGVLHGDRVIVQPGQSVAVGIRSEVPVLESFGPVAVLEQDQCPLVTVDAPERDPTREDPARAPVHVRPVAVEAAALARPHEPGPPHVEAPYRPVEQRFVDGDQLGRLGHPQVVGAGAYRLREGPEIDRADRDAIAGDGIVDGVAIVDLTQDGVLLQDLVAGSQHDIGGDEPPEEQVTALRHRLPQAGRVGEESVHRLEVAESRR